MASKTFSIFSFVCMLLVWGGHRTSLAKECTNVPTQDASHTLRALQFVGQRDVSSLAYRYTNWRASLRKRTPLRLPEDWLQEEIQVRHDRGGDRTVMLEMNRTALLDSFHVHRRRTTTNERGQLDAASSTDLRWSELDRQPTKLAEFSLHNVRLAPDSLHGMAQATNLEYLLMLDVDSLVWSFRVTAGIPAPGSAYGGWEDPTVELRGHFVGHYLSATAMMWASTHNRDLLDKMMNLVDALGECQDQLGTGYLSAFPSEFFDRFEAIAPVWAPYYTIHKIMAGLLDQYTIAGNEKALSILLSMAQYFLRRVETVIHKYTIERHWNSLNEEVGGINDIMYRLFMLTGNPEHLKLAHLFDKPCFLGLLALKTDGLSGFHSNTHIPLVVGAQMRFEATGDQLYADISQYFMDIINTSHRYATGGTSASEFWTYPNRNGDALSTENQETCTTYNMLKVARNMLRWTRDLSYADYYERTLVNGILGIQRGKEPGVMIYMLPQAPGSSKAISYHGWGTPYNSFWCCYGTGIESFSKLGDSIYFEEYDSYSTTLHVVQFVSSNLTWDTAGLLLSQHVSPLSSDDPHLRVTFEFYNLPQGATEIDAKVSLRFPTWATAADSYIRLNGLSVETPSPGDHFTMLRKWSAGDVLLLDLGVSLSLEKIQDDQKHYSSLHAIFFGPYLLAGMTDKDNEIGPVNTSLISSWVVPVPASYSDHLYSFTQDQLVSTIQKFGDSRLPSQVQVLCYEHALGGIRSVPQGGTDEAAACTFRLTSASEEILSDSLLGRLVSFELFSKPGAILAHTGINRKLVVVDTNVKLNLGKTDLTNSTNLKLGLKSASSGLGAFQEAFAIFKIRPGLSGEENTISFEASSLQGCFITSDLNAGVTLECESQGKSSNPGFGMKSSFKANKGLAMYNPASFFVKGLNRQFLLFPLYAYQDERYTTYFNLTS